ncbi:hypothetical protein GQX73_g1362 [Xylaria multiplex]|uniref:Uncharacterized protein n=1 Tax=Xylaria multiplex TaxID=323545 RepID=A0A7C8NCK1_9PEZI|nr:hypothetical protein GQX73_g1362 [Xylaria multiplex]
MASSQPPSPTVQPSPGLPDEQEQELQQRSELSISAANGHSGVTSRTHTNAQSSNNKVHEDDMEFIRVAIMESAHRSLIKLESRKRRTTSPRSTGSYVSGNDASPLSREYVQQSEELDQLETDNKGSSSESDGYCTLDQESPDTCSDCEECHGPCSVSGDYKEDSVPFEIHNMHDDTSEIYPAGPEQISTTYDYEDLPMYKVCLPENSLSIQQESSHRRDNSWTSSRTWVSDEEKERARWRRIQKKMKHNGINSPFVPKTFEEYIEFKLKAAESAKEAAMAQLKQRQDRAAMLGRDLSAGKPMEQYLFTEFLGGWLPNLVGVPANSIWKPSADVDHNTTWPSYTTFNEAVHERAAEGHSGSLPAAERGVTSEPPTEEIELHETNAFFQGLIEAIDNTE